MSGKKTVCFVSHNDNTAQYIFKQLNSFLGEYINIKLWPLQYADNLIIHEECDVYVTSCNDVYEKIIGIIPSETRVVIADRALNIENIDKVFELSEGTRALMVGNTYETAKRGINLINKIGIDYLELITYYPGSNINISEDIKIALTTGSSHLVPTNISKIVDLGTVGLDLSTYVELILSLNLPKELINNISQYYLKEIYSLSLRRQKVVQVSNDFKRRLEAIINTVNEAIVAIDHKGEILLINQSAENLLGINSMLDTGKKFDQIFPQIDLTLVLKSGLTLKHEIKQIFENNFVINANPILDNRSSVEGVVIAFQPVGEVQKIETKVRRELKRKNNVAKYSFDHIVGSSKELNQIVNLAREFCNTDLAVIIEGESGTGKELFAQAIHNESNRSCGPFVAINLAAIPDNLVDSELFGYEEGAFTGAKKTGKSGFFEEAHNGTIFLDEIGDASLDIQKKLLRVLEEGEVRRVGSSNIIPVNVRIIAATNQNLLELVEKGTFRGDLFYRLCAISLQIPSLRDRGDDVLNLINYFCERFYKRKIKIDGYLKEFLLNYTWPGNIRELKNVTKYICSILPNEDIARIENLPMYLAKKCKIDERQSEVSITNEQLQNQEIIKTIIHELEVQGDLLIFARILEEIKISSIFEKGIGRNYLRNRLAGYGENYPDHKLRQILNTMKKLGLIEQGKTKQGTKISSLGRAFLEYIEKN